MVGLSGVVTRVSRFEDLNGEMKSFDDFSVVKILSLELDSTFRNKILSEKGKIENFLNKILIYSVHDLIFVCQEAANYH